MPTYALTGGLGSGKSLVAAGRMQDYLRDGKKVATNFKFIPRGLPRGSRILTLTLSETSGFSEP